MLELSSAYRGTALVLGDVIEADDGYTGEHCKSVVSLALEVADHLGLEPRAPAQPRVRRAAARRRQDRDPQGDHQQARQARPRTSGRSSRPTPLEGQKMLERVGGFMREVGLIVRSHHERWDGGGYPDGLVGEQIPLEARIITCCDTWNAMRTDRPYRKALSHDVARGRADLERRHASSTRAWSRRSWRSWSAAAEAAAEEQGAATPRRRARRRRCGWARRRDLVVGRPLADASPPPASSTLADASAYPRRAPSRRIAPPAPSTLATVDPRCRRCDRLRIIPESLLDLLRIAEAPFCGVVVLVSNPAPEVCPRFRRVCPRSSLQRRPLASGGARLHERTS